ncbi:porin [Vibrio sp. PNB23_22_7]
MKKNLCAAATICLASSPALFAQPVTLQTPTLYGTIRAQAAWHDNYDYKSEIYQAEVGVIGMLSAPQMQVRYHLEAEYSESLPELAKDNDLMVREASVTLLTKNYGSMHIGSGTSGAWKDLYSKVDIFESNNMERHSDNLLFTAKRYGNAQLALATPKFGNFQLKAAVMSPNEHNGSDVDVLGVRVTYQKDALSLAVNHSIIDKAMPQNSTQDSYRTAAAASYQWGALYLGALAEFDYDTPTGDRNAYGISSRYQWDQTSFSFGYQFADWQSERHNESLFLANVTHKLTPNIALYTEAALYDDKGLEHPSTPASKGDNVNIGLIVSL